MTVLRVAEPEHRCQPPVVSRDWDAPTLPIGSAWRCDTCGQIWLAVKAPRVYAGQQRVPPLWREATWRESRRARREAQAHG
jgi:hypothetical protein